METPNPKLHHFGRSVSLVVFLFGVLDLVESPMPFLIVIALDLASGSCILLIFIHFIYMLLHTNVLSLFGFWLLGFVVNFGVATLT